MTSSGSRTPIRPAGTESGAARSLALRRLRMRRRADEDIEVDLSPLIDCVFLLLIFFLVTTMLKKLEKQIPVVLPDYTATLSEVAESDTLIYALDADGAVYRADNKDRNRDGISYRPVADLTADLTETAARRGNRIPIRLDTDREVPVQKVIDVLDTLALQGFDNVGVRLRHRQEEFFLLEDLAR